MAATLHIEGALTATGGLGGRDDYHYNGGARECCNNGGPGSVGRIRLDYDIVSGSGGTVTPTTGYISTYLQPPAGHATGGQITVTVSAASVNSYTTLTHTAMAVATTLAGSIAVTKHNDAALPTNDPGILVNTATQLKVTLGTASIGVTTVSMSMSNTDGTCTFCQTSGGTYATAKTQTIAN